MALFLWLANKLTEPENKPALDRIGAIRGGEQRGQTDGQQIPEFCHVYTIPAIELPHLGFTLRAEISASMQNAARDVQNGTQNAKTHRALPDFRTIRQRVKDQNPAAD